MTADTLAARVAERLREMDRELDQGVILGEDFTHHALPALARLIETGSEGDWSAWTEALKEVGRALGIEGEVR